MARRIRLRPKAAPRKWKVYEFTTSNYGKGMVFAKSKNMAYKKSKSAGYKLHPNMGVKGGTAKTGISNYDSGFRRQMKKKYKKYGVW